MWVAGLLVVTLPLVMPTTVLVYPILPFPGLPMLMTPSLYPKMGNRPFDTPYQAPKPQPRPTKQQYKQQDDPTAYHTCHDHTAEWHEWEHGSSGTVKVKRNGSRLAAAPWDLKLVFTHPVSLQVYNGVADVSAGSEFQVAPPAWGLGRSSPSKEDRVSFKVTFPASGGPRPELEGIVVNGKYHKCPGHGGGGHTTYHNHPHTYLGAGAEGAHTHPDEHSHTHTGGNGGSSHTHTHGHEHDHSHGDGHTHSPGVGPHEHASQDHAHTRLKVEEQSHPAWPSKVLGLYILLADDDEDGFDSKAEWNPELFPWQQKAANVLFFTFIHPGTMEVPPSFQKLAASRGSNAEGSVPSDTVIMFAIGGYSYSLSPNPWTWLTSKEAAEEMAVNVAAWPEKYGCDGIDLDLEEGAGARREAGPNMIHFIRKIREIRKAAGLPRMTISQPTYGYPQVQAEIDVINASWDSDGSSSNVVDSVGLMVYEGTQALNYVKNYANGSGQWQGFPVTASAPTNTILLGAKGASSSSSITSLAKAAVEQDLLGIMVWYASVRNGFDYTPIWDASTHEDSISGYLNARSILDAGSSNVVPRSGLFDWSDYIRPQ